MIRPTVVGGLTLIFLARCVDIAVIFEQIFVRNGGIQGLIRKFLGKDLQEFFSNLFNGVDAVPGGEHGRVFPPLNLDGTYALGILPGEVEAQPEAPGLLRQFPCARFIHAGFRFVALVDIALRGHATF